MNQPFAYSISNLSVYWDEIQGNYYVFPNLKGIINFLEQQGVYPSELLDKNNKYKIESHSANLGRQQINLEDIIEKIELSQEELDKVEKFVEDFICKQEESDRKFMEEHPGEYLPRFSGIFQPNRKDKSKYIEQHLKNKSWKWKI